MTKFLGHTVPDEVKENAERFMGYYGDFGNMSPTTLEDLVETMKDARFNWKNHLHSDMIDELVYAESADYIHYAIEDLEDYILKMKGENQ